MEIRSPPAFKNCTIELRLDAPGLDEDADADEGDDEGGEDDSGDEDNNIEAPCCGGLVLLLLALAGERFSMPNVRTIIHPLFTRRAWVDALADTAPINCLRAAVSRRSRCSTMFRASASRCARSIRLVAASAMKSTTKLYFCFRRSGESSPYTGSSAQK